MRTIVFYISGHGFGHASRNVEVINALLAKRPDLRIVVRTSAPRWLFELTVRPGPNPAAFAYDSLEADTGMAQIDSLRLDAGQSVALARAFMHDFETSVAREATYLTASGAALVVSDIPPLGIAAAARAGLTAVGLGNFTWDWIYSAYPGAADVVQAIGDAYARADLALRLPMHGGFETFEKIVDLPFVARRSTRDPGATRRALGLPIDQRLVLVSFGQYGLQGLDLDALAALEGWAALVSARMPIADRPRGMQGGRPAGVVPFDERAIYAAGLRYEDLVRAVDVVVTKPGYGIIAECLANDTALMYTSRGHFVEYDVLVAALPGLLRSHFIEPEQLLSGRWAPHLDALSDQRQPAVRPPVNGADVAADLLLDMIATQ